MAFPSSASSCATGELKKAEPTFDVPSLRPNPSSGLYTRIDELMPPPLNPTQGKAVDDLDAFVARLKAKGVPILKQNDDATGRYAWIMDPDGTKTELREPKRK